MKTKQHITFMLGIILGLFSNLVVANEINMQDGVVVTSCSGTIYDRGGPNGDIYSNNIHEVLTIRSAEENRAVQLVFEELRFGYSTAFNLKIYDGPNTQSPLLAQFTTGWDNSSHIGTGIFANSGIMTLEYTAVSVYPANEFADGWKASWNCVVKGHNMETTTVTACEGALHDPGGPSGTIAGNETYVFTINPENVGQAIALDVQFANLWTSDLTLYDGPNTNSPVLWSGTGFYSELTPKIARSGSMTIELVSSGSTGPNFLAIWHCIDISGTTMTTGSTSDCEGTFYDSGGLMNNYGNNEDDVFTISTSQPNTVIKTLFLEFGAEYDLDTLWIYDGPTADPSKIIFTASGFLQHSILKSSSGPAMTFRFKSDGNVTNEGWTFNWTCRDTLGTWSVNTGIDDAKTNGRPLSLYPNPNTGQFFVQNGETALRDVELTITDILGKVVHAENISNLIESERRTFDLQLESGVYVLSISDREHTSIQRFIVE